MTRALKLVVDPVACDGRGLCAEVVPELVSLDDWGYPIVSEAAVDGWLLGEAREAVRLCPCLALRLTPVDEPGSSRRGRPAPAAGTGSRHPNRQGGRQAGRSAL